MVSFETFIRAFGAGLMIGAFFGILSEILEANSAVTLAVTLMFAAYVGYHLTKE